MKIGFFGTGLMGAPMARRLLDAGYPTAIYNRTATKLREFAERGAETSSQPETILNQSDVHISMLADYNAFQQTITRFGRTSFRNKTVIQMATISPRESREAAGMVEKSGGRYMEAPVLGSIAQVQTGKLLILFSGAPELLREFSPLLHLLGEKIFRFGPVGGASAVKLALNQLIASLTSAFSMSLGYLREQNADIGQFMEILRDSALYAPTFDKKFQRMMERDFSNPNFPVKHMLKDVELIRNDFTASGIVSAPLDGVREILSAAMKNGESESDYSALYNAIHPAPRQ